uniref:SLEI family protein putative n=2 Tax=Albugo laibachii Nc14 TaxID=890382 RepID=F0WJ32_9STRA|nr:SLEI family protein putative [Albugo laibachii Nc14]|eukprot:CCA21278.1 SLEI family protein putative [Albugo laibachii Nc14]
MTVFKKVISREEKDLVLLSKAMVGTGVCLLHQGAIIAANQIVEDAICQLRALNENPSSYPRAVIRASLFEALNIYGGIQMISRNLKSALDTFIELVQLKYTSEDRDSYRLTILPAYGLAAAEGVRSQNLTLPVLKEAIRHLNEIETRYGPDACLYLHRSNIHRALGKIELSTRDLVLVEAMDSDYLVTYHQAHYRKDHFDVNTISWIPRVLIDTLNDSLKKKEYTIPRLIDTIAGEDKNQNIRTQKNQQIDNHISCFSEEAIYRYFGERLLENESDTYAEICRLDIMRRRPLQPNTMKLDAKAEQLLRDGTILDQHTCGDEPVEKMEVLLNAHSKYAKDPYTSMLLGVHALEILDASTASQYFTRVLTLIQTESFESISLLCGCTNTSACILLWKLLLPRMRYYCFVWLSLSRMLNNESKSVSEKLNSFYSACSSDDEDNTLLFAQISVAKLLDGPLKFACKSLNKCQSFISQLQKDCHGDAKQVTAYEITEIKDIFSNVGLKSFCLFPAVSRIEFYEKLLRERFSLIQSLAGIDVFESEKMTRRFSILHYIELFESKANNDAAKGLGFKRRPAIVTTHNEESHRLDQKFEEGVSKIAKMGNVQLGISAFAIMLFVNKNYTSGRSFNRMDVSQNKEQDASGIKLHTHQSRLIDRFKWLDQLGWRFEALADLNNALSHVPQSTDTLWSRFRLYKKAGNATEGLADANRCLQQISSHIVWKNKLNPESRRPVFINDTQRDQWLRLLLICGEINMDLKHFGEAVSKLSLIKDHNSGSQKVSLVKILELRTKCYISLKDYSHAVADISEVEGMRNIEKRKKLDTLSSSIEKTLYFIVIGNLYCRCVLDHLIFASADVSKGMHFAPWSLRSLTKNIRQNESIRLAMDAYRNAEEVSASYHLVRYLQGRIYAIIGDTKSAIQRLSLCLAMYPSFSPALFLRGCVYLKEGLVTLALVDYHKVCQSERAYPNIAISIAYCYYMQHKLDHVLEILTVAISSGDKNLEIYYLRGSALMKNLAINNAIKDFERVLRAQPLHHRALFRVGVCHIIAHRYQEAREALMQVTSLEPKWFEAWRSLAYANMCLEQYDDAVASYTRSIELVNHTSSIRAASYLERAMAYFHLKTYTPALSDLNQAVKLDSLQFLSLIIELMIYSILNDKEKKRHAINKWISRCQDTDSVSSVKWIIKAYEIIPTYPFFVQHSKDITIISERSLQPARSRYPRLDGKRVENISSSMRAKWHLFFRILVANHRSLKVLESMKAEEPQCDSELARFVKQLRIPDTLELRPRRNCDLALISWMYNSIGISSLESGMLEEAIRAFTRAIDTDSENAILYFNRSHAYIQKQRPESAKSDLQTTIRIQSTCFQAQNNLGVTLLNSKQSGDARDVFVAGLEIAEKEQDRAIIMYNLGTICHSLEQHLEAVQYYEQAIKLDNSRYEFFFNRGLIFQSQEFYKEAVEDYNRVITILKLPENDKCWSSRELHSVYVNRAQTYVSLGLCSEAIEDLMTANRILLSSNVQQNHARPILTPKITPQFKINESNTRRLWTFCVKWKQALRIAANDFIFSFSCIPCYNFSEIYRVFGNRPTGSAPGPQDPTIDLIDRESGFQNQIFDAMHFSPIQDGSFFNFEQYLALNDDKCSAIIQHFPPVSQIEIKKAVNCCLQKEYATALRHLLRAHYFCPMESHEEYLLLVWRVQVLERIAHQERSKNAQAIELLSTFLQDRQHFDSPQISETSTSDELLKVAGNWKVQRVIIRADMYSYLGCLLHMDDHVQLARKSFTASIQNRPDHIIAHFNLIMLSLDSERYEDVLHCILQVLQLSILLHGKTNESKSNEVLGLMYENRSISIIAPAVVTYFSQSDMLPLINELVRMLEKYRRQLTAKNVFDTDRIFEIQGLIAVLTEKIIYSENIRTVSLNSAELSSKAFSLDLQKLTHSVRDCTERFLDQTRLSYHSEASSSPLDDDFDTELEKLYCDIESTLSKS